MSINWRNQVLKLVAEELALKVVLGYLHWNQAEVQIAKHVGYKQGDWLDTDQIRRRQARFHHACDLMRKERNELIRALADP